MLTNLVSGIDTKNLIGLQVHGNINYNIKSVEPTKTNVKYHYLSLLCGSKVMNKCFCFQRKGNKLF